MATMWKRTLEWGPSLSELPRQYAAIWWLKQQKFTRAPHPVLEAGRLKLRGQRGWRGPPSGLQTADFSPRPHPRGGTERGFYGVSFIRTLIPS